MNNPDSRFQTLPKEHGVLAKMSHDAFPSLIQCWDESELEFGEGTTFGFVQNGNATVITETGQFLLNPGMYFAIPGTSKIAGGTGIAITRFDYKGFFQIGGPIEETGRLNYIDGCTDSLLISPVSLGDPCLNLLHIPAHTHQTAHTHPSYRAGIVVSGSGRCVTPFDECHLKPSLMFLIPSNELHSFHTDDDDLRVIAFHPDSDFGPTDETHPMVNRTIIPKEAV